MTAFKGKNVLITGAASGIGRLMALVIAKEGGNLVLWDIHNENLKRLKEEITALNGNSYTYICDVSNKQTVFDTADRVKKEAGEIDILINNAGVVIGKPFLEHTPEEIEFTMNVNLMARFWVLRAFLPGMMNSGKGHIVTIASAAGILGVSKLSVYAASKFADVGFDESLRAEFKKAGIDIKTTVVCPYFIDTGMFKGVKTRFSFLLPILKPEYVAAKIIKAIKKNKKRLCMPRMVYLVPLLRVFPVSFLDAVANLLGVNSAMDPFEGRK
jgi:all-trans-retinol dehydrogenase (NAD+)